MEINKIVRGQDTSHVTVFESDEHLLSLGHGNVNDYVIMTAGNIKEFPVRQSRSVGMTCNDLLQNDKNSVRLTGSIILSDTSEETPFSLTFTAEDEHRLRFRAEATATDATNYLSMAYYSPVDEEIYGMGL